MQLTGKPFGSVLAACVIPFVPGDLIKLVLTVPLAVKLRPVAARYLYPVDPDAA
jgi:biotin transport system substrate-specific component